MQSRTCVIYIDVWVCWSVHLSQNGVFSFTHFWQNVENTFLRAQGDVMCSRHPLFALQCRINTFYTILHALQSKVHLFLYVISQGTCAEMMLGGKAKDKKCFLKNTRGRIWIKESWGKRELNEGILGVSYLRRWPPDFRKIQSTTYWFFNSWPNSAWFGLYMHLEVFLLEGDVLDLEDAPWWY